MPGQEIRKKSVRQKLTQFPMSLKTKRFLLVDDSIVRGTTSKEIIEMARGGGREKGIYRFRLHRKFVIQCNNGIDMQRRMNLIAHNRNVDEICKLIGADKLIFQDLDDLIEACICMKKHSDVREI